MNSFASTGYVFRKVSHLTDLDTALIFTAKKVIAFFSNSDSLCCKESVATSQNVSTDRLLEMISKHATFKSEELYLSAMPYRLKILSFVRISMLPVYKYSRYSSNATGSQSSMETTPLSFSFIWCLNIAAKTVERAMRMARWHLNSLFCTFRIISLSSELKKRSLKFSASLCMPEKI